MKTHGVAADDKIVNVVRGEYRQQISEVQKHGPFARHVLEGVVRAWPNLFAEYTHFTLEVARP